MSRRPSIGTAVLEVLMLLGMGCRQVVGIEERVADDGTAEAGTPSGCGLPFPQGACAQCVEQKCCAQAQSCVENPSCAPLETCRAGCSDDPACRVACAAAHRTPNATEAPALEACVYAQCADACGLGCGTFAPAATVDLAESCETCVTANVCEPIMSCVQDIGCMMLVACNAACPTMDCRASCELSNPSGAYVFYNIWSAGGMKCAGACGFGSGWSCVGNVTWPPAKSSTIAFMTQFVDGTGMARKSGLHVKMCQDAGCNGGDEDTSDANGEVTLLMTGVVVGYVYLYPAFLDVAPADGDPDPTAPTLVFWGYPVSEPESHFPIGVPAIPQSQVVAATAAFSGGPYDETKGTLLVAVYDCLGDNAPDIQFEAAGVGGVKPVYNVSSYPSLSAKQTDFGGAAFYFNVPPGPVDITARYVPTGQIVSSVTATVRAGTLSFVAMSPTPQPNQ